LVAGWDAKKMKNRKRSKYSGRKYKRYRKGFWGRYKGQRKWKYVRCIVGLKRLLDNRPDPYTVRLPNTVGRPPANPKDIVIFLMFKQLFCLSYMDTESFLLWICGEHTWLLKTVLDANTAQEHISDIPLEYLEDMLEETICCLNQSEVTVIIDATGLSLNQYGRWMTVRNGKRKLKKKFVKIHLAVDRDNGKILVGLCSKGWKHEHKFGVQIVKALRRSFSKNGKKIKAELLDSGYLSREMTDEIEKSNAKPYIKMKKNSRSRSKGSPSWKRNIRFQKEQPGEFMKEFCYRVVIEGIISAFKKMFGSVISSKKRHNQNVEVLCRLVLWNCMH
jgi:transposase